MVQHHTIIWMLASCLFIVACRDDPEYDGLSFMEMDSPPLGYETSIESDHIQIPAGIVQAVRAEVQYKGDRYLIGSYVELVPRDESVFSVLSMGEKNEFLLIGSDVGGTCVNVIVNGKWEECIDVTVE